MAGLGGWTQTGSGALLGLGVVNWQGDAVECSFGWRSAIGFWFPGELAATYSEGGGAKCSSDQSCIDLFSKCTNTRRCDSQTYLSRCGLSSWMRAYCGRDPAGCGNSARSAGRERWTAATQRQTRPSAPASGRRAHDGLRLTRTACCWRGPQPSWAHPCLTVSAPALCRCLKDFGGEYGLRRSTCERIQTDGL